MNMIKEFFKRFFKKFDNGCVCQVTLADGRKVSVKPICFGVGEQMQKAKPDYLNEYQQASKQWIVADGMANRAIQSQLEGR